MLIDPIAAPLSALYGRLADTLRAHLDAVNNVPTHRAAVEFVDRARSEFQWLVTTAEQNGSWDGVLEAAVSFDW